MVIFFLSLFLFFVFFFNDTATTEIYTLSLHDALPISVTLIKPSSINTPYPEHARNDMGSQALTDRKSTRLNSSHVAISYAVFCLKKKKNTKKTHYTKPQTTTQTTPT